MGLLIYGLLTVLLVAAVVRKRSAGVLLLLQLLPFFFICVFLWVTRDQYPVLLVKKIGYEFDKIGNDYKNPSRTITLGGNQQKDDVYLSSLPPGAVRISPSVRENTFTVDSSNGGTLILRNGTPLNLIYLHDGDTVESGEVKLTFHSSGSWKREFETSGKKWEWPRKSWNLSRVKEPPVAGSLSSRLISLSEIAGSKQVTARMAAGMERFHVSKSRQPLSFNRVFLAGGGNQLRINGEVLPSQYEFLDGDRIEIFAVETGEPNSRLRRVADFTIRNQESARMIHSQPETMGIKEELLKNGSPTNKPLLISTSTLPYSMFPAAQYKQESAKFSGNFAFVQTDFSKDDQGFLAKTRERFADLLAIGEGKIEVVTDSGKYETVYGGAIALGKQDRILFSIDRVRFPWHVLRILIVLTVLKMLFQPPFYSPFQNGYFQLIVVLLDFFLVSRFLFSFRAASLYPFSTESMELSLLAFLLVPYLLFAAGLLMKREWGRKEGVNFATYSVAIAVCCYLTIPARLWLILVLCVLLASVAIYRFTTIRTRLTLPHRISFGNWGILHWLCAFTALALVLQWLGAGEAVRIAGIRIPLAIAYHPIFLLFVSASLVKLYRIVPAGDSTDINLVWRELAILSAVFASFFLISFAVSDFGFFLLYCLPVLFVLCGIAALYISRYELKWKTAGAVMALPTAAFLFLFTSYSTISKVLPDTYGGNRYVQRILLAVNPQALEDSGLVAAEKQLGHQRTFMAYAHAGWNGGGFMGRSISPALGATALNDNVPSAFLLNDFGIAGFSAVLAILICIAWLWWRGIRISSESIGFLPRDFIEMLSLCALITFLFTDLYMILANSGIFLFTGKNVFLWGLNSVSDIFHSVILLTLVLLPGILRSEAAPALQPETPASSAASTGEVLRNE